MTELLMIVASLLLVLACGVFVAAEFALVTVDRSKIDKLATKGDKRAQGVQAALRTLSTQLSGAQIGITVTNLAIGFLAEPAIAQLLEGPFEAIGLTGGLSTTISVLIALLLATFFTMLFGELVPKNLAIARPVQTAKAVQVVQRSFSALVRFPIALTNGSANIIVRRFGIEPQEELASARSMEELLAVVKHSAKRGTLAKDTAVLLERSLEFGERHASDVMTPRVKLEVVLATDPVSKVIEAVKQSGYSRFPVMLDEIDNIVGIIHVRDAVAVPFKLRSKETIKTVMQPVVFTPSSIELDTLIEKMREENTEAVITIDEYGGVDGLVTFEDLVEELVGEVKDEHDENARAIRRVKKNVWSISGLLRSDEAGDALDIVLPEDEEFETVGGLVFDLLEKVPVLGDQVSIDALNRQGHSVTILMKVTNMDGRRIDRLQVTVSKRLGVSDE